MQKHIRCPICKGELSSTVSIHKPCPDIRKEKFCFSEQRCRKDNFSQLCDLYGTLLVERIHFLDNKTSIEVNYVLHKTIIYITPLKLLEFDNRLIELDYPNLIDVDNKIKTLLVFS